MGEERDAANTVSNVKLYCIMLTMLFFGTCNTIVMKAQDKAVVGTLADGKPAYFTHPYFQCANMFVGEFTCLLVYFVKTRLFNKKSTDEEDETPLSPGTKDANKV